MPVHLHDDEWRPVPLRSPPAQRKSSRDEPEVSPLAPARPLDSVPNEAWLLDAIERIYEAALAPQQWPTILKKLAERLRGATVRLQAGDPDCAAPMILVSALGGELSGPLDHNPHPPFGTLSTPASQQLGATEGSYTRGRYELLQSSTSEYHAVLIRGRSVDRLLVELTALRLARAGPFARAELELLCAVAPHAGKAVSIQRQLASVTAERDARGGVLDRIALGVILVNVATEMLFLNRSAREILAAADGLSIRNGRLSADQPSETAGLSRLVVRAAMTGIGHRLFARSAMSVSRPSMRAPLVVLVAPVPAEPVWLGPQRPAAAVFVRDPERRHDPPAELLRELYDCTQREAALALALLEGHRLDRAAARLRISVNTAKTHLQHLFSKTGLGRQSELIRLIVGGPGGLRFD